MTDIILNDGDTKNWITMDGAVVRLTGADFMLDSPERRGGAGGSFRRALVHNGGDVLAINFNNDYSGGVRVNGASVNLRRHTRPHGAPLNLPKSAAVGDLFLVHHPAVIGVAAETQSDCTLWLCVGHYGLAQTAQWRPLNLGNVVDGTS